MGRSVTSPSLRRSFAVFDLLVAGPPRYLFHLLSRSGVLTRSFGARTSRRMTMRRRAWLIVLVAVWASGASFPPSARSSASRRVVCDLGTLSAENHMVEGTVLATARAKFERSLSAISQRDRTAAGARFVTDLAAYVYGYPIV